jgi:hypothetical protein
VPLTADETVAVNVMACPATDGFKLLASVVDVVAAFTTWVRFAEVLAPKFTSPP